MMKVVIIADSLALPRPPEIGGVEHEETYPHLLDVALRKRFGADAPMVIEKGERARTIKKVYRDWMELVTWRKPEIVIVQVGVVDSAPRVFRPWQRALIDLWHSLPYARVVVRMILGFVNRHRRRIIRTLPQKVYTPLPKFEQMANRISALAEQDRVKALVFVNIVSPPDWLERKSPGFQENVRKYNEVLARQGEKSGVRVVDLNRQVAENGGVDNLILADGHHLNAEGNGILARQLEDVVAEVMQRSA